MSIEEISRLVEGVTLKDIGRIGVRHLHQAASDLAGGSPILKGATSFCRAVKNGRNTVIASGFTIMGVEKCETDGPIGSVMLGKFINLMGSHVIFLTDTKYTELFETLGRSIGLSSFQCLGFPIMHDQAEPKAAEVLEEFSPSIIIAIERPGWNRKSIHHNMKGVDISSKTAKIDYLFKRANANNVPTIGIGDGGNEIGMGNIFGAVAKHVPFGSTCRCPCGGGIASITRADHLIVASVSNWGAYGMAAIAARLAKLPLDYSPSEERRLIKVAVKAGAVDGVTGRSEDAVDGLNLDRNAESVESILRITHVTHKKSGSS